MPIYIHNWGLPSRTASRVLEGNEWDEAIGLILPRFDGEEATLRDLAHEIEAQGVLKMESTG